MNDRPGTAQKSLPFQIGSIDLGSIPGQSKLFVDHTHRSDTVLPFYPTLNSDLFEHSETVLRNFSTDRNALCGVLLEQNESWGAGDAALANIERLRSEACVAVMTGQQAGLFSGPAYTMYKAVSAVLLAGHLTSRGQEAVPIFWIASEDHDLEEVSTCGVVGANGSFTEVKYLGGESDVGKPVEFVRFRESVTDVIDELSEVLPDAPGKQDLIALLRDCYKPGTSFSEAFARMMARLFADYGLILFSPMDDSFRSLAFPLVKSALKNAGAIRDRLLRRDSELEAAGCHRQVNVTEDFFPFFFIDGNGARRALRFGAEEGEIVTSDGEFSFGIQELIQLAESDPSILSPSALMRPVVQDFVFPNVCYFGGAAEIAYFGQNSAIYEVLERPVTPVRHRSAFTIIEPRNRRALESYGLNFLDLLDGQDIVSERVAATALHPETASLFDTTEYEITALLDALESKLAESDGSLAASLERRRRKMLWHVSTLREKFLRSEALKDDVAGKRLGYLFSALLPKKVLQERSLSFVHFLNLYGTESVDWLFTAGEFDQADHRTLTL